MLLSILVYGFMMISTYFIGDKYNRRPKSVLFWLVFIFAVFSGVRYDVGVDYLSYKELYEMVLQFGSYTRKDMEVGFAWLCQFLAYFKCHYVVFFTVCALLQIVPVFYAFREERYVYRFIIYFILATGQYFFMMNGMRQGIAFSFIVCAFSLAMNRKWIVTMALLCVASSFHTSVLLFLPFFLLCYFKRTLWVKKRWGRFLLIAGSFFLPSVVPVQDVLSVIESAVMFVGYDRYADISNLLNEQNLAYGARSIVNLMVGVIVAAYANKVDERFKDSMFPMVFNLYFIGLCATPFFIFSQSLMRFVTYFNLFQFLACSYVGAYLYQQRKVQTMLSFMLFVSLYLWISIYVATERECVLYQFFSQYD